MKKITNNIINKAYEYTYCLIKIIFWLAKNDISLNKFSNIIQFGRALESSKIIFTFNSIIYENLVSDWEFLSTIALLIEEKIW